MFSFVAHHVQINETRVFHVKGSGSYAFKPYKQCSFFNFAIRNEPSLQTTWKHLVFLKKPLEEDWCTIRYWKSNIYSKQQAIFNYKSSNSQQNILLIFTLCSISLHENTRTYCILDSFWTHRCHTETLFSQRKKRFPSVKGIQEQAPVP